jgi:hypothetical protein
MCRVRVDRYDTEEVFTAAFSSKQIALEVDEHIATRRLGEATQPFAIREGPQLVYRRRLAARFELDSCLLANPFVCVSGAAFRLEGER